LKENTKSFNSVQSDDETEGTSTSRIGENKGFMSITVVKYPCLKLWEET
jgi:hypothetical protein